MSIDIKLEIFEGPMDLLLSLINENEIDIYNIPIGYLTDKYLSYLEKMENNSLEISTDFLLMASTLLEIKSKLLLPKRHDKLNDEAIDNEEDPRQELVERLIEYKGYKDAVNHLKNLENMTSKIYYRNSENFLLYIDNDEIKDLDSSKLLFTMDNLIAKRLRTLESNHKDVVILEPITTKDAMEEIIDILSVEIKLSFWSLFKDKYDIDRILTFFLAILELIKLNEIDAIQEDDFEDILLVRI